MARPRKRREMELAPLLVSGYNNFEPAPYRARHPLTSDQRSKRSSTLTTSSTSSPPAPPGFKWVFCRYRRVKGSKDRYLDAHEYGYEAWRFLVRA